ncbi:MAG: sodium:calcium antiporter [Chthonomonadales bacterium]
MMTPWILLIVSLGIILVGCDLFTNGIEWAGKKLNIAEGAVGSVLAAVGTCLPETLIAIIAIMMGKHDLGDESIGIGAILGAPLMLSTLAFFITGLAVFWYSSRGKRSRKIHVDHRVLARDLRFFFLVFGISAGAAYISSNAIKAAIAFGLLALYGIYVVQTFRDKRHPDANEDISPLHFRKSSDSPQVFMILGQSAIGVLVLTFGSKLFVDQLAEISISARLPALALSLVITPIATELPEKFNSVLWIRQKKDTLALGNISGAMVFQSSVPPAIGLLFTKWVLQEQAMAAILVALASSATIWLDLIIRKRVTTFSLTMGGIYYLGYLAWLITMMAGHKG